MIRFFVIVFSLLLAFSGVCQSDKIDSLFSIVHTQSGVLKSKSLNELSWHYKYINIDSALMFANQSLKIGRNQRSKEILASSYNSLGNAYEAKSDLDSSEYYHLLSLKLRKELSDSLGIADSYNNLGIVYDEKGQYANAISSYYQAIGIYEKLTNYPSKIAMVLGNLGIVYKKQKEYEKVYENYSNALAIYEDLGSEFGINVTKGNIGSLLIYLGDFGSAIKYSEEALEGYKKAGYERYIPYMQHNIGIAYDSLQDFKTAKNYYLTAVSLHEMHNNRFELASTFLALSSNALNTFDFDEGVHYSKKALAEAEIIGAEEIKVNALKLLAKSYSGLGDYKSAYLQFEKYALGKDDLFEDNKTKQILELQTKYETEKKEKMIAIQQADLVRKDFVAFGLIVLVILILIISLLFRNKLKWKQAKLLQDIKVKAKESQMEAVIDSQEKERNRFARDLHDTFGQLISVLTINLNSLKEKKKPSIEERELVFSKSAVVLDDMYKELKNICFDLMPQSLLNGGLHPALTEFASRINQTGKLAVELNLFNVERRFEELQEISIYRITQEWVNNILKYSTADQLTIQVTGDEEEITLVIEDNGMGFDKNSLSQGSGNGWKNINSRINLIHGDLELDTVENRKGNTFIVNLPLVSETKQKRKILSQ